MTPRSLQLDGAALRVEWAGAAAHILPAALLRRHCRCAQCRRIVRDGGLPQAAEGLRLLDASAVGSYAVQLHFSDGHERGIYPWAYLRELAGLR
jgi:DUF971 family protein